MATQSRLWYLYDFANSFASVVLIFYFPLLFVEKGGKELVIGFAASLATLLLMLCLPPIGRWADATGKRVPLLWVASVVMSAVLVVLAVLFTGEKVSPWLVILLYIIFQFCFQGSVSIYSSLLRFVAKEDEIVPVSGKGIAFGQLGNVLALAAVTPIISGGVLLWGFQGKPLAFLFGAVFSFAIALPFLLKAKSGPKSSDEFSIFSYRKLFHRVYKEKHIFWFLLGMMLLADAILTFQIYLTLYASRVFDLSEKMVSVSGLLSLIFVIVGALVTKSVVQRAGSHYSVLRAGGVMYATAFFLLAVIPATPWLLPILVLMLAGISYGIVFTLGRVIYAEMIPVQEQSEFFGIYTLFERVASIVGPLVWAGSFWALALFGEEIQYRGSVIFLMVVAVAGLLVLKKSERLYNVHAPTAPINLEE